MEETRSQVNNYNGRFKIWASYLAFNVIVLFAVASVSVEDSQKTSKHWAVALSIISLLLTATTTYVHSHDGYRGIILNSKYELGIIIALIVQWIVLVPLVSSPSSGLAVEEDGAVFLANMYYFTWAGFINGVVLLASFMESIYGISVRPAAPSNSNSNNNSDPNIDANTNGNIKRPSMVFIYWFALMTSSIIVMGSSADIYSRSCQIQTELKPQPYCSRTTFAIVAGTIATQACLLVIISKLTHIVLPFLIETALCAILFVLYSFELFYATGAEGPGSPLGNLYYFSWISFLLCFGIGKECYDDYVDALTLAESEFEGERMRRGGGATMPSLDEQDVEGTDDGMELQQRYEQQQQQQSQQQQTHQQKQQQQQQYATRLAETDVDI